MANGPRRLDPGQTTEPVTPSATYPEGGPGFADTVANIMKMAAEAPWKLGEAQVEAYSSPEGVMRDLMGVAGGLITGAPSLPARATPAVPAAARLAALDDYLWESLSPAGVIASLMGAPESAIGKGVALAGVPMGFIKAGKGPGMGKGTLTDVHRGIVRQEGKELRTTSKIPEAEQTRTAGDFRPFHAGSERTAWERLKDLTSRRGTPGVAEYDIPVRGTLGTFEKPLEDPGNNWVKEAKYRDALNALGIDAIIYRNTVEGHGDISVEALADMVVKRNREFAWPSEEFQPRKDAIENILQGIRDEATQLGLPGVKKQAKSLDPLITDRPRDLDPLVAKHEGDMTPAEAIEELSLWDYLPRYASRRSPTWGDFMDAAVFRRETMTRPPEQLELMDRFGAIKDVAPIPKPAYATETLTPSTDPPILTTPLTTPPMSLSKQTATENIQGGDFNLEDLQIAYSWSDEPLEVENAFASLFVDMPQIAGKGAGPMNENVQWATKKFSDTDPLIGVDQALKVMANHIKEYGTIPGKASYGPRAYLATEMALLRQAVERQKLDFPSATYDPTNSFMSIPGWNNNVSHQQIQDLADLGETSPYYNFQEKIKEVFPPLHDYHVIAKWLEKN